MSVDVYMCMSVCACWCACACLCVVCLCVVWVFAYVCCNERSLKGFFCLHLALNTSKYSRCIALPHTHTHVYSFTYDIRMCSFLRVGSRVPSHCKKNCSETSQKRHLSSPSLPLPAAVEKFVAVCRGSYGTS